MNACHGTTSNTAFMDPFCFNVINLQPNSTYAFQIRTVNVDVQEPSDYSVTVVTTTDPAVVVTSPTPPPTTPPTQTTTETSSSSSMASVTNSVWSTVLVVATVLLLIILVAVCYSFRDKIRTATEDMVRTQKDQKQFSPVSEFPMTYRSSYASSSEGYLERSAMSQIADIQKRRLPEPPPTTGVVLRYSSVIYFTPGFF